MLKYITVFLVLLIAHPSFCQSVFQKGCQYIVNEAAIYNLLDFTYIPPKEVDVTGSLDSLTSYSLVYHLCTRQVPACDVTKEQETSYKNLIYGKLLHENHLENTICQNVTTPNDQRMVAPTFLDEENSTAGIQLTFPETLSDEIKFTLIVELTCDKQISTSNITWTAKFVETEAEFQNHKRIILLQGAGKSGCPVLTMESYLSFYKKYKILFTLAFVLVGFLALTMGYRFFHATLFILTTFISTSIIFIFISMVFALEASTKVKWIMFGISLFIGFLMGYAVIKIKKLGFFSLGFHFGVISAFFLYSFLLHFFNLSESILWISVISMALLGGLLALWLWKDIIILATSCIGSYFIVRAISFYIGGFPNELKVIKGLTEFSYYAYGYMMVMILVAIFGIIRQFKKKKSLEEESEDYRRDNSISQY